MENGVEERRMSKRKVVARAENAAGSENGGFSLEEFESGKIAVNPDWLKEVWGNNIRRSEWRRV